MNKNFNRVLNIIERKGSLNVDIKPEYFYKGTGLIILSYEIYVTVKIYNNEIRTQAVITDMKEIGEVKQKLIIEAYNICKAGMLSEE